MENIDINHDHNLNSLIYVHGSELDHAIEKIRKEMLKVQAENLKEKIIEQRRCPICTLKLPCKHSVQPLQLQTEDKNCNSPPQIEISTPSSIKSNKTFNIISKPLKIRYRGRSKASPETFRKVDEFEKLRVMEKLEKYKEEKLLKEIQHIETSKKIEEKLVEKEKSEEKKRERYFIQQKSKLDQYKAEIQRKIEEMQKNRKAEEEQERKNWERHQKSLEEKKKKLFEQHMKTNPKPSKFQTLSNSPNAQNSSRARFKSLRIMKHSKLFI